jgi:hypothetical protein
VTRVTRSAGSGIWLALRRRTDWNLADNRREARTRCGQFLAATMCHSSWSGFPLCRKSPMMSRVSPERL